MDNIIILIENKGGKMLKSLEFSRYEYYINNHMKKLKNITKIQTMQIDNMSSINKVLLYYISCYCFIYK